MRRTNTIDYENPKSFNSLLVFMTLIIIGNILTLSSPLGLLITLLQYIYVIHLILKKDLIKAYLAHMVFVLLSLSAQGTLGMFDAGQLSMYNYGTMKIIGPIRGFYLLNIIFVILFRKRCPNKKTLLYSLFQTLSIIFASGIIIGLLGCLINPYYSFDSFVDNTIYIFVTLSTLFVLVRLIEENTVKQAYYLGVCAIISGIVGSFICYTLFHITSHYSVYDIPYIADIAGFVPVLIIGYFTFKHRIPYWSALLIFLFFSMDMMGGKSFFQLGFCLTCLIYLAFFDYDSVNLVKQKSSHMRFLLVVVCVAVVAFVGAHFSSESMAFYKFKSALSMFSGDISEMSRSPYIRVASLINILHEGLSNPFTLLFGKGYGGYFEDGLNLFVGIDLSNGAWGDTDIQTGRFHSGHDTMVTVPFFNGLIGLYLILKICWLYVKKIKFNFLNGVAFLWIILQFYFNTLTAATGVFLLFAAEYNLLHSTNDIHKSFVIDNR